MLQTAAKPEQIEKVFFSQTKALKMRVRGRNCDLHGKVTVGDSLRWDSAHHVTPCCIMGSNLTKQQTSVTGYFIFGT